MSPQGWIGMNIQATSERRQDMRIQQRIRGVALAGIALALLVGVLSGGAAWAQAAGADPCVAGQPCFSNVTDILNGRRHLLRDDHLILGIQVCIGSPCSENLDERTIDLRTSDSSIVSSGLLDDYGLASNTNGYPSVSTLVGRMFNLPYDVAAFIISSTNTLTITDPGGVEGLNRYASVNPTGGFGVVFIAAAMGDFNQDGYADIAFVGSAAFSSESPGGMLRIITAQDPNTPSQGVVLGPRTIVQNNFFFLPSSPQGNFLSLQQTAMAVGDFDGDGQPEIAVVSGATLSIYTVDKTTLTITQASSIGLPGVPAVNASLSLAAGRFGNTTHDQLVLVWGDNTGATAKVASFDFDTSLTPTLKDTLDTGIAGAFNGPGGGEVQIRSGQFDWSGSFDQAALKLDGTGGGPRLGILTFASDGTLSIIPPPVFVDPGGVTCSADLAVGNFDRMQSNSTTMRDPDLQLAVVGVCAPGPGQGASINIYNVDPSKNFSVSLASSYPVPGGITGNVLQIVSLAAGDTETPQGRSAILGAPTKVVINRRGQPSVVLATPPMHVDYIAPANQTTAQVLNVSAIPIADLINPVGYYAKYQKEEGSSTTSSTTTSTSWSAGVQEKADVKATWGDPDVSSVSIEDKFSAQQQWQGSVENAHESVTSSGFDVSIATSFGDAIWYDESRLNLYIYPVIGKQVCPATTPPNPNCDPSQQGPLTVQFSGVDAYSSTAAAGNTTEWYQPPWEPGNVLSYPGNLQQLLALEPDLDQVSDPSNFTWATDNIPVIENTYWKGQSQGTTTTSFDQNYSFKNTLSFSGDVEVPIGGLAGSTSISVSASVAFSRLHTGVTTLQESTGIQIVKPGTFLDPPNYRYQVTPFIYGHVRPDPVLNTLPLDTPIQTFGILQTAYVVDPLDDAGGWWSQAYNQAPDVALNHPTRWTVGLAQTDPGNGTCLFISAGTSDVDCAARSPSAPTNPWLDEFHTLRGFFISGAEANGGGPQLEKAHAGDKLLLQVRVHNYSLVAMSSDTTVHARFYGQPWDNNTNTPIGASFLIGEATQGPIQPFNTDTATPNWRLIGTTFDTNAFDQTKNGDVFLTFWVVVWMEDSNGKLVGEMPGHGLTGLPGTLTSFADAAALEEIASDGHSYSNNVGFYKLAFYLFPPPSTTAAASAMSGRHKPAIRMGKVEVSAQQVARNERVLVSTTLQTGDQPIRGGLTVLFYDGDPAAGLPAFDVERMVHLRADDTYDVRVPFRSSVCGKHDLVVVAGRGTAFEQMGKVNVHVKCK
jgi:hypothetical protein